MLTHLTAIHLPAGFQISPAKGSSFFILKTCLRTFILDLKYPAFHANSNIFSPICQEVLFGEEAYISALEILCGLQSKILGESEVVSQFKEAYHQYLQSPFRQPVLIRILEKLLKDSKEVRRRFLTGISQKSYASLARKLVLKKAKAQKLLLIGSGKLAVDLIHQFQKWVPLTITARNHEKVTALAEKYQLSVLPWNQLSLYRNFPHIVSSIGAETTLFDHSFFSQWSKAHDQNRLFIDFGSPSPLETCLGPAHGVYRLQELFEEEQLYEQGKLIKIHLAKEFIREMIISKYRSIRPLAETETKAEGRVHLLVHSLPQWTLASNYKEKF